MADLVGDRNGRIVSDWLPLKGHSLFGRMERTIVINEESSAYRGENLYGRGYSSIG